MLACARLCGHVSHLGSRHGAGPALVGDGLYYRYGNGPKRMPLIYCVAITEMMKQSLAWTIYRHTHS